MSSNRFNERISKLRAEDPKVSITFNPQKSAVHILRGRLSDPAKASDLKKSPFVHARRFIAENKALLGNLDEGTELSDGRALTDDSGGTHVVFYQKYGDARVMGGTISVHYGDDRAINLIKSDLVYAIDLPAKPKIGPDKATEIAIKDAGRGAEAFRDRKPELFVVDADAANIEGKGPKNYLCWKIGIVYPDGETNPDWIYFVDALTGKVIFRTSAIQTGTGTGLYSQDTDLFSERWEGTWHLRDTKTSSTWPMTGYAQRPAIHTYNNAGSGNRELRNYSEDPDNNWNNNGEGPPANHDNDQRQEVDIHRFLSYVMDYYYNDHLWRGMDGLGTVGVEAHAHTGCLLNEACFNAHYERLYFNTGDWVHRNFISTLDIVGHEFTHGVLFYQGILQNYQGETGAVNEAICDLFGYLIALRHERDCPQPRKIGHQSYIASGGRIRDIGDPSRDEAGVVKYDATNDDTKFRSSVEGYNPDHYSIRYTGPNDALHDWGGAHINSTIISHAVYLMMHGGTHRISPMPITGIGVPEVERILYWIISTGLLNDTSNLRDFRTAFLLACNTLYPHHWDHWATVSAAFYAVGLY
jgi:bacillolysin